MNSRWASPARTSGEESSFALSGHVWRNPTWPRTDTEGGTLRAQPTPDTNEKINHAVKREALDCFSGENHPPILCCSWYTYAGTRKSWTL